MAVTEVSTFFIHSPSIPMTLKDDNSSYIEAGNIVKDFPTLDPGHEAILEMHANSESSALFYVVIVLVLYIVALIAVVAKYLSTERYDNRLTRLYDEFMSRDRYMHRVNKQDHQPAALPLTPKAEKPKNKDKKVTLKTDPEFMV